MPTLGTDSKGSSKSCGLLERARDIVLIYRLSPEKAVEYISPSVVHSLGYMQEKFYKNPDFLKKIIHNDDSMVFDRLENNGTDIEQLIELRLVDKEKNMFWYEASIVPLFDKEGKLSSIEAIMRNISARKDAENRLAFLSFHDSLTNVYNRAYYMEELQRLDTDRQLPLSMIMADVNGLKLTNDAFGHEEGDKILKSCARVLKQCCRSDDIVARFGGDEFAMLLPRTSESDARRLLERIMEACVATKDSKIPLSISLGAATKNDMSEDFNKVIKKAEEDMYRHKLVESKGIIASIISSLESTLFERKIRTKRHFNRLKQIVTQMGRKLKLSEDRQDDLRLLATVHDIGKVAILDNILNKKSGLSENEWRAIKKHPEIGYRIAMSSNQLSSIAEYILSVHEHWDGSGYPQGLKGSNIPLISRIMALADSYVIMREGRPYKNAMSKQEAIKEIKKCSGTQFDPKLVKVFLDVIEDMR